MSPRCPPTSARGACLLALSVFTASACAGAIDLLQGRVEAEVASHHIVVTDCYRIHPPAPERLEDENGVSVYRFAPCRDAIVTLRGDELQVNGRVYGELGDVDEIVVDHGQVLINRKRGAPGRGDSE